MTSENGRCEKRNHHVTCDGDRPFDCELVRQLGAVNGVELWEGRNTCTGNVVGVELLAHAKAHDFPHPPGLLKEFRTLSRLAHPLIPKVLGLSPRAARSPCLFLESGGSWQSVGNWAQTNADIKSIASLLDSLLGFLEYIHAVGVAHTSLASDCIWMSESCRGSETWLPRIIGFQRAGSRRSGDGQGNSSQSVTGPSLRLEPEVQADLLSVGAIATGLLSTVLHLVSRRPLTPAEMLSEIRSDLPDHFYSVLQRMLAPEEALRIRGAREARSLLRGTGFGAFDSDEVQRRDCGTIARHDLLSLVRRAKRRARCVGGHALVLVGPKGSGKTSLARLCRADAVADGDGFAEFSGQAIHITEDTGDLAVGSLIHRAVTEGRHGGSDDLAVLLVDGIESLSLAELENLADATATIKHLGTSLLLLIMCDRLSFAPSALQWPCRIGTSDAPLGLQLEEMGVLKREEMGFLMGETLHTEPCGQFVDWIAEHTDGSPFFVRELTRSLASNGCLSESTNGLTLNSSLALDTGVPDSVQDMLRERVTGLSDTELKVARIMALGPGMTSDIVVSIAGLSRGRLADTLWQLDAQGLIGMPYQGHAYSLTESPLAQSLWPESESAAKQALHEQVARLIQELHSEHPAGRSSDGALAWHLSCAGHQNRAFSHALSAALGLLEAGSTEASESCLCLAEKLWPPSNWAIGDPIPDMMKLVDGYWRTGRTSLCARACRLGLAMAESGAVSTDAQLAQLNWTLGRSAALSGDPDGAMAILDEALDLARSRGDRIQMARVLVSSCFVHSMRGENREIERLADESMVLLEGSGDRSLLARSYNAKGNALTALCQWQAAKEWYGRAAEVVGDLGDASALSVYVCNWGLTYMALGEWDEAEHRMAEALSVASRADVAYSSQLALQNLGCLWMRRGILDESERCVRDAMSWAERTGDEWGLAMILVDMGQLEFARGNPSFALGYYDRAEGLMSEVGSVDDLPELLRARAEALSAQGRHGEARESAEESRKLSMRIENGLEVANSSRVLGEIAACCGELDRASELCGEATDALRAMGAPYELAQSLAVTARVHRERGELHDAVALFEEARDTFRDLGARRDSRVIQEELAEMAGALQLPIAELPGEREHLASLYRSSQVLASSESQREAARELADIAAAGIPAETVAVHLLRVGSTGTTYQSSLCEREGAEQEVQEQVPVFLKHLAEGEPIIRVAHDDQRSGALSSLLTRHDLRSLLVIPMMLREQIIGLLYLDYRKRDATFSDEDVRFVEALAAQAAIAIDNVRLRADLEEELETLRWEVDSRFSFANIIGQSVKMQELFSLLQKVAATSVTVLIEGDSGTGKELVARAIHFNSSRKHARFVPQNCAALPEQLLESELFGHVRGAFTGALKEKGGLFEAADRGTFFLDEIADMPPSLQVKLLRVLQDGEIRRVGATESIKVDVRIVAATNKSLEEEVEAGRFREDLFYRLNVVRIRMPTLKERRDDIPLLAQHFLDVFSDECDKNISGFTDRAMDILVNYDWPGNVRELENEIQRAVALSKPRAPISAQSLSERFRSVEVAIKPPRPNVQLSLKDMVEGVERRVIAQMLDQHKWNKSRTAEALGLSRQGLLKKIARLNLTPDEK